MAAGRLIVAVLVLGALLPAQERKQREFSEHEQKAGYLVKLFSYVEWPGKPERDAPLVIGILGKSPFGNVWKEIDGKEVKGTGRKLAVRHFAELPKDDGLAACHILFVCASEHERQDAVVKAVGDRPIMTVIEGTGRIERGLIMAFVLVEQRIKLELNARRAAAIGLKISAQLQSIAVRRL